MIDVSTHLLKDPVNSKIGLEIEWLQERSRRIYDGVPVLRDSQPASGEVVFALTAVPLTMEGVTITVGSTVYTYGIDFQGRTSTEIAQWFAASINGNPHRAVGGQSDVPFKDHWAAVFGSKVVVMATVGGVAGNLLALATSNSTEVSIPVATLAGGVDSGIGGAIDSSIGALCIIDKAPAIMHREGPNTLFNAVTATGVSFAVSGGASHNHGFIFIGAGTASMTVVIEVSNDNINYATFSTNVITSDGITLISASETVYTYWRANVTAYTSGNVTVQHYAGN